MSIFKLILGVLCNVVIFAGLLFLPAGTLEWWRAWGFLGVVLVSTVAGTMSVLRANPALLDERFKPPIQKGQPRADQIVVLLLIAAFIGEIVFIPVDVFRLHLHRQARNLRVFVGACPLRRGLVDHDPRLTGERLRGAGSKVCRAMRPIRRASGTG
jgi:hypothetical protein